MLFIAPHSLHALALGEYLGQPAGLIFELKLSGITGPESHFQRFFRFVDLELSLLDPFNEDRG